MNVFTCARGHIFISESAEAFCSCGALGNLVGTLSYGTEPPIPIMLYDLTKPLRIMFSLTDPPSATFSHVDLSPVPPTEPPREDRDVRYTRSIVSPPDGPHPLSDLTTERPQPGANTEFKAWLTARMAAGAPSQKHGDETACGYQCEAWGHDDECLEHAWHARDAEVQQLREKVVRLESLNDQADRDFKDFSRASSEQAAALRRQLAKVAAQARGTFEAIRTQLDREQKRSRDLFRMVQAEAKEHDTRTIELREVREQLRREIAERDERIAGLQREITDHAECVGELEYAKENTDLTAKLAAANDRAETFLQAENDLSMAYVRLRQILGAFDTPYAPSPETIWAHTEEKARAIICECSKLRAELDAERRHANARIAEAADQDLRISALREEIKMLRETWEPPRPKEYEPPPSHAALQEACCDRWPHDLTVPCGAKKTEAKA